MDDLGNRVKQITREFKHYVETRLELTFLNFSDRFTYVIGQSIQQLVGWAILGLGLVFGMIALAIYLGEVLQQEWAGYAIVAAPFIILGFIFVIVKPKSIARKIQDQLLEEILDSLPEKGKEMKQLPEQETLKKESKKNG